MKALEVYDAINFDLELGFEHGYNCWKYLDEWNLTMIYLYRKESNKRRGNFDTSPS